MRAITAHFDADTAVIIGSQAILVSWPDAPLVTRMSVEIDAYPANARAWEAAHAGLEASEEINALFGFGSLFHQTHGFYIDGVDDTTARFPPGWQDRAVTMPVRSYDRTVTAIAPHRDDLIVSKLHALRDKDKEFIAACHAAWTLDLPHIKTLFAESGPSVELTAIAIAFLNTLPTL